MIVGSCTQAHVDMLQRSNTFEILVFKLRSSKVVVVLCIYNAFYVFQSCISEHLSDVNN